MQRYLVHKFFVGDQRLVDRVVGEEDDLSLRTTARVFW